MTSSLQMIRTRKPQDICVELRITIHRAGQSHAHEHVPFCQPGSSLHRPSSMQIPPDDRMPGHSMFTSQLLAGLKSCGDGSRSSHRVVWMLADRRGDCLVECQGGSMRMSRSFEIYGNGTWLRWRWSGSAQRPTGPAVVMLDNERGLR